ncbi:MAG: hypothetical protein WDN72_04315 [Alphaproteobacteria bacterium]
MQLRVWARLLRKHWPLTTVILVAVAAGNLLFLTHYFNYAEVQEREEWVAYTQSNIANVLELSIALHKAVVDHGNYLTLASRSSTTRPPPPSTICRTSSAPCSKASSTPTCRTRSPRCITKRTRCAPSPCAP